MSAEDQNIDHFETAARVYADRSTVLVVCGEIHQPIAETSGERAGEVVRELNDIVRKHRSKALTT